jgi:enoyl-[acyl-carrier protein] reductase I
MVREFEGKNYWALILGGSTGLGLATAIKLARHGLNICVVHRNSRSQMSEIESSFARIADEGVAFKSFNVDALKATNRDEILHELKTIIGENGRIRVLVHSIAKGNLKPMIDEGSGTLNSLDFELTINAMAISLYDWTKAIFGKGLFAADARIISFTSEGNSKAWKHYAAVSAAKAALESITRNIALEFSPYGIRANCIQSGICDTASFRMIPGNEQLKQHAENKNPFKRLTKPEDVADAVYLLCKDEAAWINGCVIPVDGGEHIR